MVVSVRPIAIGDVCRRLPGKHLLPFFAMRLCTRWWRSCGICLETNNGWISKQLWLLRSVLNIGLKIDFINAFNSVARSIFLTECFEKFPQIFKWVYFCYSKHSHLLKIWGFYNFISIASRSSTRWPPWSFSILLNILSFDFKIKDRSAWIIIK